MRILYLLILFVSLSKAIPVCQSYSELQKIWGGNIMQLISLQAAMSVDFSSPKNNRIGGGAGVSLGMSYAHTDDEREVDFGWRIKYLFLDSGAFKQQNHFIGASFYIHPFPNPYHKWSGAIQTHKDCENKDDGYPTPFSFVIGGGATITHNTFGNANGGYIEAGIALFKWFPINGEILYRLSIFPQNRFSIQGFQHSINFVLNIL